MSEKGIKLMIYTTSALAVIILAVGLVIGLTRVNQSPINQTSQPPVVSQNSPVTNQGSVKLLLNTSTKNFRVGDEIQVQLDLDTLNSGIRGVETEISFDPKSLQVNGQVVPGNLFKDPVILENKIDNQTGKIFFSIGSFTPYMGSGTCATIKFKTKSSSNLAFIKIEPTPNTKIIIANTNGQEAQLTTSPLDLIINQ